MEKIKLNQIVDIFLGLTHTPNYVSNGVPFLSVKDISNGSISFENCKYITKEEFDLLPEGAKPKPGDMLFCRVGTLGKPLIVSDQVAPFGTFVSLGYLRNKKEKECDIRYLKYWMYSESFWRQVKANVKGASQVNLNTGWLSKFDILLPEIIEQKKRIEILAKCEQLIDRRKDELQLLDELIKARFFELMQAYPSDNTLEEYISAYKAERCGNREIPVLSITKEDGMVLQSEKFKKRIASVDASTYKVVPRGKLVQGIHIDERNFAIQNIIDEGIVSPAYKIWNVNEKKAIPEVLAYAMRTDRTMAYISSKFTGSVKRRESISMKDFMATPIDLPNIKVQTEFYNFMKQVDKSKVAVRKSLDFYQELFDKLMNNYFGD